MRNPPCSGEHPSGKCFGGNCWARHPGGELPKELQRTLGIAGLVSTLAYLDGSPHDIEADDVFDRLQAGEFEFSEADAVLAEGYTLADVVFALDVLRTLSSPTKSSAWPPASCTAATD